MSQADVTLTLYFGKVVVIYAEPPDNTDDSEEDHHPEGPEGPLRDRRVYTFRIPTRFPHADFIRNLAMLDSVPQVTSLIFRETKCASGVGGTSAVF